MPRSSIRSNVLCISEGLVKKGHQVQIYTTCTQDCEVEELRKNNIQVTTFPSEFQFRSFRTNPYGFSFSSSFLRSLKSIDGDLIHAHGYYDFETQVASPLLKKIKKIPFVLSTYGSVPYEYSYSQKHKLMKIFLDTTTLRSAIRSADLVFAETNFEKEHLVKFGAPNRKIRLIYGKVDTDLFRPRGKSLFEEYDSKIILYVGRINRVKGITMLIHAFGLIIKRHRVKAKLILVGSFDDQIYLKTLREIISSLDMDKHVIFFGSVDHKYLPEIYSSTDVLVLPSLYENIGGVLLEAQACGCPVVATNVGGMSEVLINGQTGYLIERDDIEGMADRISLFLCDKETRRQFGENGRELVSRKFSDSAYVERILKYYSELIDISS